MSRLASVSGHFTGRVLRASVLGVAHDAADADSECLRVRSLDGEILAAFKQIVDDDALLSGGGDAGAGCSW